MNNKLASILVACGFFLVFLFAADSFTGQSSNVNKYYTHNALEKTGSANVVNSIVWDFRGYDTLGEETVLFTAIVAVFLIAHKKGLAEEKEEKVR